MSLLTLQPRRQHASASSSRTAPDPPRHVHRAVEPTRGAGESAGFFRLMVATLAVYAAMIIAPMTVAVESAMTPAEAITAESVNMIQKADSLDSLSPDRRTRSSVSSSSVRRWFSGSTRRRRSVVIAAAQHVVPGVPSPRANDRPMTERAKRTFQL